MELISDQIYELMANLSITTGSWERYFTNPYKAFKFILHNYLNKIVFFASTLSISSY